MPRLFLSILGVAFTLFLVSSARADGKVFRRGVAELPPIPDQQAIISWDPATKTETLAIETRFAVAGSSSPATSSASVQSDPAFAWIVPIPGPAAPTISAATSGTFPTVREIFQPRVIDSSSPDGLFFSVPLASVLLLGVWLTKVRGSSTLMTILILSLGFTCVGGLLLPTLGKARGSAGGPQVQGVQLLERSIIGSYDVAVVGADSSADSGVAVAAWLRDQGFDLPAAAAPILADYAARRWVFAAVKLRPDSQSDGRGYLTPHPLVFRFACAAPVYPMRLTGLGNVPLTLDLYVFGAERAHASGLTQVRCDHCWRGQEFQSSSSWYRSGGTIALVHPDLAALAGSAAVATKLTGTLSPSEQATDIDISFAEFQEIGREKHSPRSAVFGAVEKGALVFSGLVVVLVIVGVVAGKQGAWVFRRLGLWALVPSIILAAVVWACTPTIAIVVDGRSKLRERENQLHDLCEAVETRIKHQVAASGEAPTVESVREAARDVIRHKHLEVVEEDSPRNYRVQQSEMGVDLLIYNSYGAPIPWAVWPPRAPDR